MADATIPVVLMRGGTSKGVFVRLADLPPAGPGRDRLILALMGSPDPMQLDGLGGTHSSTSKLVAVAPSDRPDSDVEYVFAQVGIDTPHVDYAGNCGNLTAAVGPYAIDEGMVSAVEPMSVVRLYNRNTDRRVVAHVPVAGGRARTTGDQVIAGVPGRGAPIVTEYLDPAGAATGALLPTGRVRETVHPEVGDPVEMSIVDVSGPVAMVRAADLGVPDDAEPAKLNADPFLLERFESIRAASAVLLGWTDPSPALPRLALVAAARPHQLSAERADLSVRVLSMQRVHHACPLTVLQCLAASALMAGTVTHELATADPARAVRIAHPKGVAEVEVTLGASDGVEPCVQSVSVTRTARRLLEGRAYLPARLLEGGEGERAQDAGVGAVHE